MYSTKRINKNNVDGNAFITIGDPFNDRYSTRLPSRWKSKQFHVDRRPQNAQDGYFTKLNYSSEKFHETEKYGKTQPLSKRKLGFGTKDAFKRGEFTATIRTEQYRETVKHEHKLMANNRRVEEEEAIVQRALEKRNNTRRFVGGKTEVKYLYDIGRTLVNEFDPKSSRDTFYKFSTGLGKRTGEYRTMSADIGETAWEHKYEAPEFGPTSHIKHFSDRSHLEVHGF